MLCCAFSSKEENVASRREITQWSAVKRESCLQREHIFAFERFATAFCIKSKNAGKLTRGNTAYWSSFAFYGKCNIKEGMYLLKVILPPSYYINFSRNLLPSNMVPFTVSYI